jgi:hypothetical protein
MAAGFKFRGEFIDSNGKTYWRDCVVAVSDKKAADRNQPSYGMSLAPMSAIAHLADLQSQFQYVAKVPSPASY